MFRKFAICLMSLVAGTAFVGCNSDEVVSNEFTYSSTMVLKFSLKPDSKILSNLDSVFFSIDLVNAKIFNADSLPYGTDISRLLVNLSTDACSKVELKMKLENGQDSTINYLTNSTDSIDFSHAPVKLHLVSLDQKAERDYEIKVNVHKVESDLLYWNELAMRRLPSLLAAPTAQKSVRMGDLAVTLTSDGNEYCLASTSDPAADNWDMKKLTLTFKPDINTLAATDEALFVLSDAGELFTSADGDVWTSTGQTWNHIYGAYGNRLLGNRKTGTDYYHVTYPATAETKLKAEFPVTATGTMADISSRWSDNPQKVFVGGINAGGKRTNSTWGYDGEVWAKLGDNFPDHLSGAGLFNYEIIQTDTITWTHKRVPVLMVVGGRNNYGTSPTTYISRDMGLNWKIADDLLQLPDEYIAARYDAQPLVFNSTLHSRAAFGDNVWTSFESKPLPVWYKVDGPIRSRAVAPITEWECPYIYLFGGYSGFDVLFDSVWKGVLNSLTFKPLE